tara:strand:+ start:5073 stop:5642 length:570 start_codon:yes stop_codon:yes gene_type:complete
MASDKATPAPLAHPAQFVAAPVGKGKAIFTVCNPDGQRYTFKINGKDLGDECGKCDGSGYWINPRNSADKRKCFACDGTGEPKQDKVMFISMLTGPDNTRDYTYMGMFNREATDRDSVVRLTAKSSYTDDTLPVKVARWALFCIMQGKALPDGYTLTHEGYCGRCGRLLTVPTSVEQGFGPVCVEKIFG